MAEKLNYFEKRMNSNDIEPEIMKKIEFSSRKLVFGTGISICHELSHFKVIESSFSDYFKSIFFKRKILLVGINGSRVNRTISLF